MKWKNKRREKGGRVEREKNMIFDVAPHSFF